jgi:hypothetical protein
MPKSAATAQSALQETAAKIEELLAEAVRFVPRDRGEAMIRKWMPRTPPENLSEDKMIAMAADAVMLSANLLLSQPSASGTTAIDRLARGHTGTPAEAKAIAALCKARFQLLSVDGDTQNFMVSAHDVISGDRVRIFNTELVPLSPGMPLFSRVAMLGDGVCCLPGMITPLDAAAFVAARDHAASGATGVAANARWAEAVYTHVVRYGTLDVPGVNRPSDNFDEDDDLDDGSNEAFALAIEWMGLSGDAPDEDLLERTRQLGSVEFIVQCLVNAVEMRGAGQNDFATAIEQLLLVQMEAALRREKAGSSTLTLDSVRDRLDQSAALGRIPPSVSTLFASLRQRLAGRGEARRTGDPALERLVQRIQGLRAKTVAHGCTEQEALAAAEKVAELLDRHGLSLSELDFRAQPCDGIGIQTNRRRMAPIDTCMTPIAGFFDCRVWVEHRKGAAMRYVFFGLRGDVAAAQYLYEMVERAFESETNAFRAGELYAAMAGERRTATTSFQTGLARGICDKLKTIRAARDKGLRSASGRDLVPVKAAMVDEEMAKLGLALRQQAIGGKKRLLADAFTAGQEAGQRFEIAHGISHAA